MHSCSKAPSHRIDSSLMKLLVEMFETREIVARGRGQWSSPFFKIIRCSDILMFRRKIFGLLVLVKIN